MSLEGKMQPFTVLLLRPDDQWGGPPWEWVVSDCIWALTGAQAARLVAQAQARADEREADDYDVLAVYAGHMTDVLQRRSRG